MFFKLGLIESFGSGIRRAKQAMLDNGSPGIYFEPSNDTDDYTKVTIPINPDYAASRRNVNTGVEGSRATGAERMGLTDLENVAMRLSGDGGRVTSAILAVEAGVSRNTATRALRGLVERGLLAWHGKSARDSRAYYSRD